jgi:hypothetical protein
MTHGKDRFTSNDPPPRTSDNARSMPAPLPSITDLGRHAAVASERYEAASTREIETGNTNGRQGLLYDRELAFRSLLLTFRAETLSDAAVQLYAGSIIVDTMDGFDLSEAQRHEHFVQLRRVFLSVLPIVAATAQLDLAEIGADCIADYADLEFPAEA